MKKKLLAFWRKLDRRLILLICIVVIPINLLAIAFSGLAVREARERVTLMQIREFEHLAAQEETKLRSLESWYDSFISNTLSRLVSPRQFSAVNSITYVNQMGNCLTEQKVAGFAFLWEHQEEEKCYVKGSPGHLSLSRTEELKHILTQDQWPDTGLVELQGEWYYQQTHHFQNYTLGYAVHLGQELAQWDTALLTDCRICFSDGTQNAVTDQTGAVLSGEEPPTESVIVQATMGKMTAVLLEPAADALTPGAYEGLQALAWGSLILLVVLWITIRRHVIHPIWKLQKGMERLEEDVAYRMEETSSTEEFAYLFRTFNKMAEDIQSAHEKDIQLYQTQLNNLKLQVNPHLLLNSLTAIYSLAETHQDGLIQKFTMSLVEYFRYCLRENNDLVPLENELRFVQSYMELQKLRFPGELSNNYLVQDGLEQALIPPLLIQNFVENAAKYARTPDSTMEILIWVRRDGEQIKIDIVDTGKGMEEDVLRCLNQDALYTDRNGVQHIGVWNCRRRLRAFFGPEAGIAVMRNEPVGTMVQIHLPIRWKEEKK